MRALRHSKHSSDENRDSCKGQVGGGGPLKDVLRRVAVDAATNDSRFHPIGIKDMNKHMECGVSVLHTFEDVRFASTALQWHDSSLTHARAQAADAFDWIVGTHGISISFRAHNHRYSATYLPYVAADQGWDHESTLKSLVKKSGYTGKADKELLASIKVERYQASKCDATWHEWQESIKHLKKKKKKHHHQPHQHQHQHQHHHHEENN